MPSVATAPERHDRRAASPVATPVQELREGEDGILLHLAASRLRAALGGGDTLSSEALVAIHPTFSALEPRSPALATVAALCGLRPVAGCGNVRFADAASPSVGAAPEPAETPPGRHAAADTPWVPPVAQLGAARTFAAVPSAGPARTEAERLVLVAAAVPFRPSRLKELPGYAGHRPSEVLHALNAVIARGEIAEIDPKPGAAEAWRSSCEGLLALLASSGRVHAPFAARRLGLRSTAEAVLVGSYLVDRGLARKDKGAYLAA
jgi:hypothetical protein